MARTTKRITRTKFFSFLDIGSVKKKKKKTKFTPDFTSFAIKENLKYSDKCITSQAILQIERDQS